MATNILLLLICCVTSSQQIAPQPKESYDSNSGLASQPTQPYSPNSGPALPSKQPYSPGSERVGSSLKCLLAPGEERVFQSLEQYQSNKISFNPNDSNYHGNEVKFSTEKFEERLKKNSFVSYDSNHIFGITLAQKQLRFIDDGAFLSLDCLYFLDLSLNNLTTLSRDTFLGLPNLKILNVSFNAIRNVADEFGMKHLYNLDLSHNELRKLPCRMLLKSLKVLNISYNLIEQINEDIFDNMFSLEELYLDHNRLHVLELLDWEGLRSMRKLDVAYNFLGRVDLGSKFATRNLELLNISGNNMTDLKVEDVHIILKKLKILDIRNNNWRCDVLNIIQRDLEEANISIRCHNSTFQSGSGYWSTEAIGSNQINDHFAEIEALKLHVADLEAKLGSMKYINIFLFVVITVLAISGVVVKFGVFPYIRRLFGRRDTDFIDDGVERIDLVRR